MRSLRLACRHAGSEHERLVYEGWMLLNDRGDLEAGLRKAEESIALQRSFEGFFLKAYALACSSLRPSCYPTVISILEDALSCPSDRLRKGQVRDGLPPLPGLKELLCSLPFFFMLLRMRAQVSILLLDLQSETMASENQS